MQTLRLYNVSPMLRRSKFYTAGIEGFPHFLILWPWPDDLHIRTWLVSLECAKINFLR